MNNLEVCCEVKSTKTVGWTDGRRLINLFYLND